MVSDSIEYSDKQVTPFGGMVLMKEFIDQLGIDEYLEELDLPRPGSNRGYKAQEVIESFWVNIWTGASRYNHCNNLRQDEVLKKIFAYQAMPSQSTYSRFFGRFSQARNTRVFPELQRWFLDKLNVGALTIDFDSTVITRAGDQQGSAKGYNPNRRGRNSHHPLVAFISQTRMVANAWLRPGNTAASSNAEAFMHETFSEVLKNQKVGLVRADSGFYSQKLLSYLEQRELSYVIAARFHQAMKHRVYGIKEWVKLCDGIELSEFDYKPHKGKSRRHIVIGKEVSRRPDAAGKMLFEDLPEYRYSIYVTNLDLPLDQCWNIYNTRADCQNRIKELKADFGLESFCLEDFWATEASFRFIMVAYNIISLFRHFTLQDRKSSTLKTLRAYCFALGAWTSTHANKTTLKISLPRKRRPWMDAVFHKIEHITTPFDYSTA